MSLLGTEFKKKSFLFSLINASMRNMAVNLPMPNTSLVTAGDGDYPKFQCVSGHFFIHVKGRLYIGLTVHLYFYYLSDLPKVFFFLPKIHDLFLYKCKTILPLYQQEMPITFLNTVHCPEQLQYKITAERKLLKKCQT